MFRTVSLSVIRSLALYTQQQVYVTQVKLTACRRDPTCKQSFLNLPRHRGEYLGSASYRPRPIPLLLSAVHKKKRQSSLKETAIHWSQTYITFVRMLQVGLTFHMYSVLYQWFPDTVISVKRTESTRRIPGPGLSHTTTGWCQPHQTGGRNQTLGSQTAANHK